MSIADKKIALQKKAEVKSLDVQIYVCDQCKQTFRTRVKPIPLLCKNCRIKKGENPYEHKL